jgi:hypothetical protein
MAAPVIPSPKLNWKLAPVAAFSGMRVLTWDAGALYASRGYEVFRANIAVDNLSWEKVARFRSSWWRDVSSASRLTFRLMRDGFHALAVLSSGHLVAAVPGAIVMLPPGESEFRMCHQMLRGTRPLHISATPDGKVFWGEYFDNAERDEVHIYVSEDHGATWDVAYTFPPGTIRHVHNIIYDEWRQCLWVLTGDNGDECRILRSSCDFRIVETVLSGSQQTRAAALVPTRDALYFSSDTPHEYNYIYGLDARGNVSQLEKLTSSSIYGCRVGTAIFFSTMIEPSEVNSTRDLRLYGSLDGDEWSGLLQWRKDRWPMKFFQYGNVFLPDGRNASDLLALTTIGVTDGDLQTSLWRLSAEP